MTARRTFSTILLAAPLTAAGCGYNEQIDLVGTAPLPALSDARERTALNGRPSLTHGLNRQDWPAVAVQVPRDQVEHGPTYATNFRWSRDRGPWNPSYPTATEAIVDPTNAGADVADGFAEPVVTAALLAWAPIDMIFLTQPWKLQRSPSEPYALVPGRTPAYPVDWFGGPDRPSAGPTAEPGDATGGGPDPNP